MPRSATGTSATDAVLRSARRRGAARGFTLMEMLVVLLIIGIVTAGVLLSLNLTGSDPALTTAGQRLLSLMRYARGQAELQTRDYGIVFDPQDYQFVVFSVRRNLWRAVREDDALRKRSLPSGVSLQVVVDGRQIKLADSAGGDSGALTPQVMLYASGDLSSFSITLERAGTGRGLVIEPNADGRIVEQPLAGATP